jgi:hypothetical protein
MRPLSASPAIFTAAIARLDHARRSSTAGDAKVPTDGDRRNAINRRIGTAG